MAAAYTLIQERMGLLDNNAVEGRNNPAVNEIHAGTGDLLQVSVIGAIGRFCWETVLRHLHFGYVCTWECR